MNKKGQCPACSGIPLCPFCGQVPLGDVSHALKIAGGTFVTALSFGLIKIRHKVRYEWFPKIKAFFHFGGVL